MAGAFLTFGWYYRMATEEFWRDQRRSGRLVSEQLRACYAALVDGAAHLIAAKLG
ncbi:MAG: hypothetical protein ACLTSZ_17070 [Lachnospiraceae bacterium]